jgi:hypothetical protein
MTKNDKPIFAQIFAEDTEAARIIAEREYPNTKILQINKMV